MVSGYLAEEARPDVEPVEQQDGHGQCLQDYSNYYFSWTQQILVKTYVPGSASI